MDERKLFMTCFWVAVGGTAFSLFCLATSGAGDDADSFRIYVLSSAIVAGASILALALCRRRDE